MQRPQAPGPSQPHSHNGHEQGGQSQLHGQVGEHVSQVKSRQPAAGLELHGLQRLGDTTYPLAHSVKSYIAHVQALQGEVLAHAALKCSLHLTCTSRWRAP